MRIAQIKLNPKCIIYNITKKSVFDKATSIPPKHLVYLPLCKCFIHKYPCSASIVSHWNARKPQNTNYRLKIYILCAWIHVETLIWSSIIIISFFFLSCRRYLYVRWCSQRIDTTTPNGTLVWWATLWKWSRWFSYVWHQFRTRSNNTGTQFSFCYFGIFSIYPLVHLIWCRQIN